MKLRTLNTETVDIFNAGPRAGTRMNGREYKFRFTGPQWLFPTGLSLVSDTGRSTMSIDISCGLEIKQPREWK